MNLIKFPCEVNAIIACYLGDDKNGDLFRQKAGSIKIKEMRNGRTYCNGVLHSYNDKPAIIYSDKDKKNHENIPTRMWYKHGKRHREGDKPAVTFSDGTKFWYKNGKLHREEDKPAEIHTDGTLFWYKNGILYKLYKNGCHLVIEIEKKRKI